MRRLLTLAIVCGGLSQFGATCHADNRDDDTRENAQRAPSRPGWTVVPQRREVPVSQDRQTPVTRPQQVPVTQSGGPYGADRDGRPSHQQVPVSQDQRRLRYHETGPGTGLWVYENDDLVPEPTSLEPVSIQDEPRGAVVPPAPAGPGGDDPEHRLEPIPDERFRNPEPGPAGDPALTLKPGQFATAQVKLYPVSEDRTRNIAPGAVQAVVAVRHPLICPFPCRCHRDQVAFAKVWVPPWPARRILVEKHGTELELDYGSYQVTVESQQGQIEVTYHD